MIKVNKKYAIDSDSNAWMVKKFTGVDKDGQEVWVAVYFYPTLSGAVKGLTDLMTRTSAYNSVTELSDAYTRAVDVLTDALGEMGK